MFRFIVKPKLINYSHMIIWPRGLPGLQKGFPQEFGFLMNTPDSKKFLHKIITLKIKISRLMIRFKLISFTGRKDEEGIYAPKGTLVAAGPPRRPPGDDGGI
jgi:hypothetical protein